MISMLDSMMLCGLYNNEMKHFEYWNQKGEVIYQSIFHGNRETDVLIDAEVEWPK